MYVVIASFIIVLIILIRLGGLPTIILGICGSIIGAISHGYTGALRYAAISIVVGVFVYRYMWTEKNREFWDIAVIKLIILMTILGAILLVVGVLTAPLWTES